MLSQVKNSLRTHNVKALKTPQAVDKRDSELYEVVKQLREEIGEMRKVISTYRSGPPRERKRIGLLY